MKAYSPTLLVLLIIGIASELAVAEEFRKWTDASGRFQVEAQFAGLSNGEVTLRRRDGSTIKVPLNRLGTEDRKLALRLGEASGKNSKPENTNGLTAPKDSETFVTGSIWVGTLTDKAGKTAQVELHVTERKGTDFLGKFFAGGKFVRDVKGTIRNGRIAWLGIKGGGDLNEGQIVGSRMETTYGPGGKGNGKMSLSTGAGAPADEVREVNQEIPAAVDQWLRTFYADQYVPGKITHTDELELKDGRKFVGKRFHLPRYVLFITNEGRQIIDASHGGVRSVKSIPRPGSETKPNLPDLDVTYIERTPRTRSNHGNVDYPGGLPKLKRPNEDRLFPRPGTKVTFTAHIANRGSRESGATSYRWLLDGQPIGAGKLASLAPNAETTAAVQWDWQDGPHEVTFAIDPTSGTPEISRLNNQLTDRTDALGFLIHVTRDAVDQYNSISNLVDTFSFEDWVQHHFRVWNFIFLASIHPDAPEGCLTRCRVDKIIYVNPASIAKEVEEAQRDGHEWGNYFQGTWHFEKSAKFAERMGRMEWAFIHEMGHQLGLIDEYKQDINVEEVRLPGEGPFAYLHHLHSNTNSMMGTDGPTLLSDHATVALNRQVDRPRGYFGDYQFEMPSRCSVRLQDRSQQPLSGAEVTFYRRYDKGRFSEDGKLAEGTTNKQGEFLLPNQPVPEFVTEDGRFRLRPNIVGKMSLIGEDGSVVMKVRHRGRTEWHVLETSGANVAALAGRDEHTFEFSTQFAAASATPGPTNLKACFRNHNTVDVRFDPVRGAKEYRLYGKKDGEVPAKSPFVLLQTTPTTQLNGFKVADQEHMFLAVTAVDSRGHESDWSNVAYVHPLRAVFRIAVASDGTRYISDMHGTRVFRQHPDGSVDDWRLWRPPHSNVKFAGVALTTTGELLVSDINSHCLRRFTPSGDHAKAFGSKGTGNDQFDTPVDLAVDEQGFVYVADLKNRRVQVFDGDLTWKATIVDGLQSPQGLAVAGNRLYVADEGAKQVVIFGKTADTWKVEQRIEGFQRPFDVAVDRAGRIIVADRRSQSVLVFDSQGNRLRSFDMLGVVNGVAVTPDGTILAAAEWNAVHELNMQGGAPRGGQSNAQRK